MQLAIFLAMVYQTNNGVNFLRGAKKAMNVKEHVYNSVEEFISS